MRVRSFEGYRRSWVSADLVAGMTVWAVLIPESLAYATIAGVSPVVGLYAAVPALVLYALLGSSRNLVTGPMAATAALSAAAVADLTTGGPEDFAAFTAMLALATGVLALLAGLFRLGFLANFISESVLKGFVIGLALTIIVGQLPKVFGVPKGEGNFFEQLFDFLGNLGDTQWETLVVGLGSLVLVFGLRRVAPVVPGALVVVVAGIVAVEAFDLAQHGVAVVGPIDSGLPSVGLPDELGAADLVATLAAAAGVMFLAFAEGLGAAKAYTARDHSEIDTNRELVALGAANVGSGLCQGMVVNGSLSKTAVNVSAGARSQASGLVVAVMTVVTLLFLTGMFEDLPEATLGAVVIGALVELVDFPALARLYRLSTSRLGELSGVAARPDFVAAVAAMLGVLVFDTLPGLFIGIGVSVLLLVYRASRPHVAELGKVPGTARQYADRDRHPENEPVPGVLVVRVEGSLFFANVETVRHGLRTRVAETGAHALVLDAGAVPFVDVSAVEMLEQLARELDDAGVQLCIAHEIGQVRDLFRVAGAPSLVDSVYPTVQAAIDAVS